MISNFDVLRYDRRFVYNPRISFDNSGYLPNNPYVFDIITGRDFISMNSFKYVCHKNVNQEEAIQIFTSIDLPIPKKILRYSNKKNYENLLDSLAQKGEIFILQYTHSQKEVKSENCYVDSSIVNYLSDKSNLSKLVDTKYVPKKIPHDSNRNTILPCVIKSKDGKPTAGGYGVQVCQNRDDFEKALNYFGNSNYFIEEYIYSVKNFCLQFFCDENGTITYIGATDQIIDKTGTHKGNIIRHERVIDDKIVDEGYSIMRKAYLSGYYGYAGFDVLIDIENYFYFIDLNFRLNASTTPLLLKDYVKEVFGKKNSLLGTFYFEKNSYQELLQHIRLSIDNKMFIPLSIWNPENYFQKTPTSCIGMIMFDHDYEIEKIKKIFLNPT